MNALIWWSVSMSPYGPRLLDSVGVFCAVLQPTISYNISPPSSTGFLKICLMFGCGSLDLFLVVAGGKLSDDDHARLLFSRKRNITNSHGCTS